MIINYLEELQSMTLNGTHELGRDLDFQDNACYQNVANKTAWTTGTGFPGIRTSGDYTFLGNFDGKGFKIKNHYVNNSSSSGYTTLFGTIRGNAVVKNLILENSTINAYYAAGLAEDLKDNAIIDNVHVINANITGISHAGGLIAGHEYYSIIRNCSFDGTLNANTYSGGIVANGWSYAGALVSKCKTSGTITGGTANTYRGGIMGDQNDTVIIEDCYSEMTVPSGNNSATIIGMATNTTTIRRCWTNKAAGNYTIYQTGSPIIANNFYDSTTTGLASSQGATARTTVQMKTLNTFSTWDIEGKEVFNPAAATNWFIDETIDYPRLWWEYAKDEPPPETKRRSSSAVALLMMA